MSLRAPTALALPLALFSLLPCVWSASDPPPARSPATPAEIPIADFFRPSALSAAKLNPAGTRLAFMAYEEKTDSVGLRIHEFASRKTTSFRGSKVYDVFDYRWVGDDYIVYSVSEDNLYASGLFAVSMDHLDNPKIYNRHDAVQMVSAPASRPGRVLLWVRSSAQADGRAGPLVEINLQHRYTAPFDEDFSQIATQIMPPSTDSVLGWLPDRAGEIRYALGQTKGARQLFRLEQSGKWTKANVDIDVFTPLAVDPDPHFLIGSHTTKDGANELVRLNTADGTSGPAIYRDDKYDFGDGRVIFSGDEKNLVGLAYPKQGPAHVPLCDEEATLLRTVDQMLPENRVNVIISRSRDSSRLLVRSSSDRHPGTIYLVEPEKATVSKLGDLAPWLPEKLLGPVQLTTYKARDGLRLDAYVTLPANYEPGKPVPMIVLPHGGPWVRDVWGYDAESQFFASRGYAVFQPNYRGSAGYHAEISVKPSMDFRKMHDDVTDGVRAMIRSGVADPAHIAIVGASFGGYLAACGAAFEPGLYRCAVSIAGVFDWARVIRDAGRNDPDSFRHDWLIRELGDPKAQQAKFEAMSPLKAAGQIKIPMFIAHGESDPVADSSQSHRLAKALAQAGVPAETMFQSSEGHGFSVLQNRVALYQKIESFLKKNL